MKKVLVGSGLLAAGASSFAALPVAVTTAIGDAQTDLIALFAALTAAGVAIWVGKLIYARFSVK